jgi:Zn-dependent protease with chaperone function
MTFQLNSRYKACLVSILYFSIAFGQDFVFSATKYSTANEYLTNYIDSLYLEDKKKLCSDCSSKENQIIKNYVETRKKNTTNLLKNGNLILEGILYNYVDSIFKIIKAPDPSFASKKLVIVRSEIPNAYTMGEDIIYIHIGLLYRLQYVDQLAMVLCHELAHDYLNHYESTITKLAKSSNDEALEKKIKEIYKNEYGIVTELNELLLPRLLENREESRNKEFEADSIGLELFSKSKFSPNKACTTFDVFLNSGSLRDTLNFDLVKSFDLKEEFVSLQKTIQTKQESSLGFFDEEEVDLSLSEEQVYLKEHLSELLSTHPNEIERSEKMYAYFGLEIPSVFDTLVGENYNYIRYLSEGEMVLTAIHNLNISKAMYYSLNMKRNFSSCKISEKLTLLNFYLLYFYKEQFKQGMVLDMFELDLGESYQNINNFLRNINTRETYAIATNMEKRVNTFDDDFAIMIQLFKYYHDKKYVDFKDLFEVNKDTLASTVYYKTILEMFEIVSNRL